MQIIFTCKSIYLFNLLEALLKLENVGQSSSSTLIYGVIANLVIQIFMQENFIHQFYRSFSMHMMWGLMNTLQLISCIFKFNLLVPPNVYMFFKSIEEFLSMKAQFVNNIVEWVNEKVFKLNTELSDGAKGNPIQNMGTYLIAAFAIVFAMIVFGLVACFGSRYMIGKKLLDSLRNKLFYNSLLRLGIQSYLKNAILAISGWQLMSYDTNEEFKKSVIIIIMSIVVFLYPIAICFFLLMNEKSLNIQSMRASYESTYANLRIFKASLLSPTIFMFRRLLLAIALALLENYTFFQLLYVQLASSAQIIYVFKVRPYEVPFLNTIEIVNEINLSICSFLAIFFTDYEPYEGSMHLAGLREQVGWVIISICSFNILATIFKILSDVFLKIKGIVNQKMQKVKIEQSQKETDAKSCEPIIDITQLNQSQHGPTLKAKQKLDGPTIVEDLTSLSQYNLGLQENDFYYRTDDKAKIAFTNSTYKPKLSPYLEIAKELQRIPQFLSPLQKYEIPSEFKQSNLPPIFSNQSCFLPDAIKNLSSGNDADQRLREILEDIQREEAGNKRPKKSNLSKRKGNAK
ncbi:hypothetical protein FGO68_gene7729 [Halteria grandinella]|uniref:Transmembrane protein n=1 Tax=Halteria grandinella TaxID=5974 RepID=A0A8J8P6K3_HALGN|nr:hypothetical protein FGO68_gene7729 [Halteria grandinella]